VFDPKVSGCWKGTARRAGVEVEGMAIAGIASTQILSRQYIDEFPLDRITPVADRLRRSTHESFGWVPECSFTNTPSSAHVGAPKARRHPGKAPRFLQGSQRKSEVCRCLRNAGWPAERVAIVLENSPGMSSACFGA
jgi:hypothetical protein